MSDEYSERRRQTTRKVYIHGYDRVTNGYEKEDMKIEFIRTR